MSDKYIPYSTQKISQADIKAVVAALQSGWLTGGDAVLRFEEAMAQYCGVKYSAALNSGTAALHAAMRAIEIQPGDEVIVPTLSFVATANAVLYENGTPVFCDVESDTLLINPDLIENLITPNTKAIICVDYAGQLCAYNKISAICKKHDLVLIADACHSLGASQNGQQCGAIADITLFSFHPVKQITTGEGGMVMSDNKQYIERVRTFRNHGMSADPQLRQQQNQFEYEINELGWNYRLTDIQCALGQSQLQMLDTWIEKRRDIASFYDVSFSNIGKVHSLSTYESEAHAHHLYVIKIPQRDQIFKMLRKKNIGVNVHYRPIHLHNYYRQQHNTHFGLCPVAEDAYQSILSIPIFPDLALDDQQYIIDTITDLVK